MKNLRTKTIVAILVMLILTLLRNYILFGRGQQTGSGAA